VRVKLDIRVLDARTLTGHVARLRDRGLIAETVETRHDEFQGRPEARGRFVQWRLWRALSRVSASSTSARADVPAARFCCWISK
jgi:hypothetical protein